MASALLAAGVGRYVICFHCYHPPTYAIRSGLARVPTVLPPDNLHALGSLGFAVQRFSCAEWSGKVIFDLHH